MDATKKEAEASDGKLSRFRSGGEGIVVSSLSFSDFIGLSCWTSGQSCP